MQFEKSNGLLEHGTFRAMQKHAEELSGSYKKLLEDIVQSGSLTDPVDGQRRVPTHDVLTTVRDQFDELLNALRGEKDTNQGILNDHNERVSNCNSAMTTGVNEYNGLEDLRSTAEGEHATCRNEEDAAITTMESQCDTFQQSTRCQPTTQNGNPSHHEWFATSNIDSGGGFGNSLSDTITRAKSCRTNVIAVTTKAQTCDGKQNDFELAACVAYKKIKDVCTTYNACYDPAAAHKLLANDTITGLEEDQKTMWRMVQRIHCFIDVLFDMEDAADTNNGNPSNLRTDVDWTSRINTCNDKQRSEVDDDEISITYTQHEAKHTCEDHFPAEGHPGQDVWKNAEYMYDGSSLPAHGKLQAVESCSDREITWIGA